MGSDASSLSAQPKQESVLTPLGQRLVLALRHVAEQHDELQMAVRGFERYLRKNPIADEDIRGGLNAIRGHIAVILDEPAEVTNA